MRADDRQRLRQLLLHVRRHVAHEPQDNRLDGLLVLRVERRVLLVRLISRVPALLDQVLRHTGPRHTTHTPQNHCTIIDGPIVLSKRPDLEVHGGSLSDADIRLRGAGGVHLDDAQEEQRVALLAVERVELSLRLFPLQKTRRPV